MKENELRVGNYYLYKGQEIKFDISDFKEIDHNLLDLLEPIPLTEEKLERLGFEEREKTEDGIIYGILNITLIYDKTMENDYGYFLNGYHNDVHLKYVHQLQDLYRALKERELEFK